MAFSPTDPVTAHSLWLQLRSTKQKHRRPRWHGDWNPVLLPLLLLSILALVYMILLPSQAFENPGQTVQKETVLNESPVLGSLAGSQVQ